MCNCGNKRNEFTQSLSGNVIAERNIKIWPDVNFEYTGSTVAKFILEDLDNQLRHFVKVFPKDYKKVLAGRKLKQEVRK